MIYGYARVSTTDQDTAAQVEQLTAAGAVKVFRENISGATADRPQLKKALAALEAEGVDVSGAYTPIDVVLTEGGQ